MTKSVNLLQNDVPLNAHVHNPALILTGSLSNRGYTSPNFKLDSTCDMLARSLLSSVQAVATFSY